MGLEEGSQINDKEAKIKSCSVLLRDFENKKNERSTPKGVKLKFLGVELDNEGKSKDVYNPTPPFLLNGEMVMVARVEPRKYDPRIVKPKICFFKQTKEHEWSKITVENAPVFELEDPFVANVNGEIILGGVEVSLSLQESEDSYRVIFNIGNKIDNFKQFAVGPERMKDIRIIELKNGHIGVFTRPQGEKNGRGKICYIELDNIEDLKVPDNLKKAKVVELFSSHEWGGANQLHLLDDGKIGVIGHIACFDEENLSGKEPNKNYYAMAFIFDPQTGTSSPVKIIAARDNFPPGEAKKPNLENVIFVGGIKKDPDDQWYLYAGLGDIESGKVPIDYPF